MTTILTFGKHEGKKLEQLPPNYLRYLCCYALKRDKSVRRVKIDDKKDEYNEWLWENKPGLIQETREYCDDNNICIRCFKKLDIYREMDVFHQDPYCWKN